MKRKIAWLVLPLLLGALVSVAYGRIKRPKPTEFDSRVRALMSKFPEAEVSFQVDNGNSTHEKTLGKISGKQLRPFINSLYFSSATIQSSEIQRILKRNTYINLQIEHNPASSDPKFGYIGNNMLFIFDVKTKKAQLVNQDEIQNFTFHNLHPAIAKYWIELLLKNPQIGPELRARMKN